MNRENDKFNILEDAEENIVERLANSYKAMSKEERERIFAMSERKWNSMKKSEKITDTVNNFTPSRKIENEVGKVEIINRPSHYRFLMTVTACAAAIAVIVGVAFFAKNVQEQNVDVDTVSSSDLYVAASPDNASSTESESKFVSENTAESKANSEPVSSKEKTTSSQKLTSSKITDKETVSSDVSSVVNVDEPETVEEIHDNNSENTTINISANEEQTDKKDYTEMEIILRNLMKENFYCMRNIFVLSCLPTEDTGEDFDYDDESSFVRKVVSDRFPDYASLNDYVHSVYTDSYADYLMTHDYYNGHIRYINKNGELYCDLYTNGGKGYYVDTENFDIEIDSETLEETTCCFTVKTTTVIPGSFDETESYSIEAKAVYENGQWVLESMYS